MRSIPSGQDIIPAFEVSVTPGMAHGGQVGGKLGVVGAAHKERDQSSTWWR